VFEHSNCLRRRRGLCETPPIPAQAKLRPRGGRVGERLKAVLAQFLISAWAMRRLDSAFIRQLKFASHSPHESTSIVLLRVVQFLVDSVAATIFRAALREIDSDQAH
jgi:hypothetical protein